MRTRKLKDLAPGDVFRNPLDGQWETVGQVERVSGQIRITPEEPYGVVLQDDGDAEVYVPDDEKGGSS